tara:strand:+ start:159 stop:290 length:132 start_codon:yes stop_codon:yes gene_type:complete
VELLEVLVERVVRLDRQAAADRLERLDRQAQQAVQPCLWLQRV